MKITLEYPYCRDWKFGYLVVNTENRRNIILFNSSSDRSTTSYARYLMAVHLGRYLDEAEEVDHVNNDKTDDILSNLQILTRAENIAKKNKADGRAMVEIKCPVCGVLFLKRKGQTQLVESLSGKITCCSRKCSNDFKKNIISIEERNKISKNSIIRIIEVHD